MSTTTTKRITKAMRYADIKAILSGGDVMNGTTIEDAVAFIDNELALLAKKNTSDKKPTKTQQENVEYKSMILNLMSETDTAMTCTEIQKAIPAFDGFSNQKVASLVRQLFLDGSVIKTMVKGKAMFSMA